ncbi:MAG: hypothetical protein LBT82_01235 [Oscillospiraceae bacterium]|jgi:hypothetical protein|nr:hypothetical protein [Oscillospiraceae bacterium]
MICKRTFKVFAKIGFKKIFSLILSLCLFLVNTVFSRSNGNCYAIFEKEIAQETNNSERIRIWQPVALAARLPLVHHIDGVVVAPAANHRGIIVAPAAANPAIIVAPAAANPANHRGIIVAANPAIIVAPAAANPANNQLEQANQEKVRLTQQLADDAE